MHTVSRFNAFRLGRVLFLLSGAGLALGGACGGVTPPPIPLEVDALSTGPAMFPPPREGLLAREPLPEELRIGLMRSASTLLLESPTLDNNRFTIQGTAVRFRFSDSAEPTGQLFKGPPQDPKDKKDGKAEAQQPAAAFPGFKLTPNVPGALRWEDATVLRFQADTVLDPDKDYAVEIAPFAGANGKKFAGFKGSFRATPSLEIAGKTISHIPKPGMPRPIYARPVSEEQIAANQEFIVIFDQAIDLATARQLITTKDGASRSLALNFAHPKADTFEGIKVDPNVIVLAQFANRPAPNTHVSLLVNAKDASVEPLKRAYTIPALPKLKAYTCGECQVKGMSAEGPAANWGLEFEYTNSVGWRRDFTKNVQITPKPKNFNARAQGGVNLHGTWEPGTTYTFSISGITDSFGYALPPVSASFRAQDYSAHTVMREGPVVLDEARAKTFFLMARNVEQAELRAWPIAPGKDAWIEAQRHNLRGKELESPPIVIPFEAKGTRNVYKEVELNLLSKLTMGQKYVTQVVTKRVAFNAPLRANDSGSYSTLVLTAKDELGAHMHQVGNTASVHVYRMSSGDPVNAATVAIGSVTAKTDAQGNTSIEIPTSRNPSSEPMVLSEGGKETILPMGDKDPVASSSLYPELSGGSGRSSEEDFGRGREHQEPSKDMLGFLVLDRGAYRPGSRVSVKGIVRKNTPKGVVPVPNESVTFAVSDASGSPLESRDFKLSARGTFATEITLPQTAPTGRYKMQITAHDEVVYEDTFRVAEFETPRFKVDVAAKAAAADHFAAQVKGSYFFGGALSDARVSWSIKKRATQLKTGPLSEAGAVFGMTNDYEEYEAMSERRDDSAVPVTGEGKLNADGNLDVDAALGKMPEGPTQLTFEADVTDSSYRHVAARVDATKFPYARYAGLKLDTNWGPAGSISVALGAANTDGSPALGATVEARLEEGKWLRSAQKAESGATLESWKQTFTTLGTCSIQSGATLKSCDLKIPRSGSYRIRASVDGHDGGGSSFYAWGGDGNQGASESPSLGKKVPTQTDKKSYKPGDTARIFVQNPFFQATALLHLQQGKTLAVQTKRIFGGPQYFDVPIVEGYAPFVHASITLLPIGTKEPSYRIGAVRIPVASADSALSVSVVSSKKVYDAQEEAELVLEVKKGTAPLAGGDVVLAVVDEALLRVTNHHVKDPKAALHPGYPLNFVASDSRDFLLKRKGKAHVPGGGGSGDAEVLDTRKDFVETLAWFPNLVTDAKGRATVRVKLKDNLTEFRMMATVLDDIGASGVSESSFRVTRPFVIAPVLPAVAIRGDAFEVAALVHNNTDADARASVTFLGKKQDLVLRALSHTRVSVPMVAEATQKLTFLLEVDGKPRDKVEQELLVENPGTPEIANLTRTFKGTQIVELAIPADAMFDDAAMLRVRAGSSLYAGLGQKLAYLMDYPHGCVEQTTSGVLPLLAAQTIFPWTGEEPLPEAEIRKRIASGIARYATMKTRSGGLAYWPRGAEPNLPGTAYATRAILRADALGIREPDLLPGVLSYLEEAFKTSPHKHERIMVAEVLAQAKKLPASASDALFEDAGLDLPAYGDPVDAGGNANDAGNEASAVSLQVPNKKRGPGMQQVNYRQGPFELASIALALSTLPNQESRVEKLLDAVESAIGNASGGKQNLRESDYHYWGSSDRDRAQALMALTKLRPKSALVVNLAKAVTRAATGYSTQAASWGLMAFAEYIRSGVPGTGGSVEVVLPGVSGIVTKAIGESGKSVQIPLRELRGKKFTMRIEGDKDLPTTVLLDAKYARPSEVSTRSARRAASGPSIYRVFTDASGAPVDMNNIKVGQIVRVALRAELAGDNWRRVYFAMTDRFGAGFEPMQAGLATTGSADDISDKHPFYSEMQYRGEPSSTDVRKGRVNLYFDSMYSNVLHAHYLLRAVTPGKFAVPEAQGELMYEPESEGLSDTTRVTIAP
jgi:alpha-2-macroglobulin